MKSGSCKKVSKKKKEFVKETGTSCHHNNRKMEFDHLCKNKKKMAFNSMRKTYEPGEAIFVFDRL